MQINRTSVIFSFVLLIVPMLTTINEVAAVSVKIQKMAIPTKIKVIRRVTQKVTMSPIKNTLDSTTSVGLTANPVTPISAVLPKKLTFTRKRIGLSEAAINVLFNKGIRKTVRNAICESVHETYLNPWLKVMTLLCTRKADQKVFTVKMHVRSEL